MEASLGFTHVLYPRDDKKDGGSSLASKLGGNKLLVVGVIGGSVESRAQLLDELHAFPVWQSSLAGLGSDSEIATMGRIEASFDAQNDILFLNLFSSFDPSSLITALNALEKVPPKATQNFHEWLLNADVSHCKALLYLFLVSHIILVDHMRVSFDLSWARTLRNLQLAKTAISSGIHALGSRLPAEWRATAPLSPGRCVPSLFFLFPQRTSHLTSNTSKLEFRELVRRQKQALEKDVRLILRKANAIPVGAGSDMKDSSFLAALDPNRIIYLIIRPNGSLAQNADQIVSEMFPIQESNTQQVTRSLVDQIELNRTAPFKVPSTAAEIAAQIYGSFEKTADPSQHLLFNSLPKVPIDSEAYSKIIALETQEDEPLREVLYRQFRSFIASLPSKRVELPTAQNWNQIASAMQSLFGATRDSTSHQSSHPRHHQQHHRDVVSEKLRPLLDTEMRFSIARCQAAATQARDVYLKDLPAQYNSFVHQSRLAAARAVFVSGTKGPAVESHWKQLEEEFLLLWKGKELCDAVSVLGRPCILRRHSEQEIAHSAGSPITQACACGRTQLSHQEAFSVIDDAKRRWHDCCAQCAILALPKNNNPSWSVLRLAPAAYYRHSHGLLQPGFSSASHSLLLFWRIPLASLSNLSSEESSNNRSAMSKAVELAERLARTPNPLAPVHVVTPATNQQEAKPKEKGRRRQRNKNRSRKETDSISPVTSGSTNITVVPDGIDIGIGFEYECALGGHRMLLNAELLARIDPQLKVPSADVNVASWILSHDLPMSFLCPLCSKDEKDPRVAQLVRLFVLTPVDCPPVRFAPKVKVSPIGGTETSVSSLGIEITLAPNSLCCARFPLAFSVSENTVAHASAYAFVLLRDSLSLVAPAVANPSSSSEVT